MTPFLRSLADLRRRISQYLVLYPRLQHFNIIIISFLRTDSRLAPLYTVCSMDLDSTCADLRSYLQMDNLNHHPTTEIVEFLYISLDTLFLCDFLARIDILVHDPSLGAQGQVLAS